MCRTIKASHPSDVQKKKKDIRKGQDLSIGYLRHTHILPKAVLKESNHPGISFVLPTYLSAVSGAHDRAWGRLDDEMLRSVGR